MDYPHNLDDLSKEELLRAFAALWNVAVAAAEVSDTLARIPVLATLGDHPVFDRLITLDATLNNIGIYPHNDITIAERRRLGLDSDDISPVAPSARIAHPFPLYVDVDSEGRPPRDALAPLPYFDVDAPLLPLPTLRARKRRSAAK